jgi:hypothetical protein
MPEKREPLPFTTPTIARLYMQQGKLDEAEAIYRALQKQRPADPRVAEGLAEVERRRQAPAEAGGAGEDAVELRAAAGDALECSYRVSEAGRRRATLVLGGEGTLTLRLCAFPGGKQEDVALSGDEGAVAVPAALRAPVIAAAVGLRDANGRFVAIAHGALSV